MKKIMIVSLILILVAAGMTLAGEGVKMQITSTAFLHNKSIPKKYTCEGDDINPPLKIQGAPQGAQSLALIVDDPDAPGGMWVHWVVFNIKPAETIAEASVPGTQGSNDFRQENYGGPCPPSGTHRYYFKIYALDSILDLKAGASKADLEKAMQGHILDESELIGLYKKVH